MATTKVTRGRSTSVSSIGSTDSYQVLSGVGDDWETLSASPSETGATVLSENEDGAGSAKPRSKASLATAGNIEPTPQSLSVASLQHTSEKLDAPLGRGSPTARVHGLRQSDEFEVATTSLDKHQPDEPATPISRPDPSALGLMHDANSSQSISLLPESPVSSQPEDSAVSNARVDSTRRRSHPAIPPREQRIWMHTSSSLPSSLISDAPFVDGDGSAVLVGSALVDGEVHPCKVTLSRLGDEGFTPVRMAYRGKETVHFGVYEVLEVNEDTMEWVSARNGRLPRGRAPVEGGYDREGRRLYYALTTIRGCRVPGKASEHDVRLHIFVFHHARLRLLMFRTRVSHTEGGFMSNETTIRSCMCISTDHHHYVHMLTLIQVLAPTILCSRHHS